MQEKIDVFAKTDPHIAVSDATKRAVKDCTNSERDGDLDTSDVMSQLCVVLVDTDSGETTTMAVANAPRAAMAAIQESSSRERMLT